MFNLVTPVFVCVCVCVFVLAVLFDDCAGNEDVAFEVSNPDFLIDENLNLVPQRNVLNSGAVLFIHGLNQHADDMAQVDVLGAPARSPLRVSVCARCVCVCMCVREREKEREYGNIEWSMWNMLGKMPIRIFLCVCVCVYFFPFDGFLLVVVARPSAVTRTHTSCSICLLLTMYA